MLSWRVGTLLFSLAPAVLNAALHRHGHSREGWKRQVCTLSLLQAGVGCHPLKRRRQLSSDSLRSWDRAWHSPTKPGTPGEKDTGPQVGSALPEQRSRFPFRAVCFHCICGSGTQLLSNRIKLSQNAGSALLTRAGDGLCPWGGCLSGEVATRCSWVNLHPCPCLPQWAAPKVQGNLALMHGKCCTAYKACRQLPFHPPLLPAKQMAPGDR